MTEDTKGSYCLILTPALTQKLALLRDVLYPSKSLAFTGHIILDNRYKEWITSMIVEDEEPTDQQTNFN